MPLSEKNHGFCGRAFNADWLTTIVYMTILMRRINTAVTPMLAAAVKLAASLVESRPRISFSCVAVLLT